MIPSLTINIRDGILLRASKSVIPPAFFPFGNKSCALEARFTAFSVESPPIRG
jgi:hypothetical protein